MTPRVVLDANVLYPFTLRDTLLRSAEAGLCQVYWSAQILDEATRNLVLGGRMTARQAGLNPVSWTPPNVRFRMCHAPQELPARIPPATRRSRPVWRVWDWVRRADRKGKPPQDKDAEIERLRRENAILREEREILKKAAVWFAMEDASSRKTRSGS